MVERREKAFIAAVARAVAGNSAYLKCPWDHPLHTSTFPEHGHPSSALRGADRRVGEVDSLLHFNNVATISLHYEEFNAVYYLPDTHLGRSVETLINAAHSRGLLGDTEFLMVSVHIYVHIW